MSMATSAPRGFVIDRTDGRAQLPGSLHTNRRLSKWIRLAEGGRVDVFTGKAELGQGILTALRLIAAEEVDLPPEALTLVTASTAHGPDEGMTSGSLSVQDGGGALRHACAEMRGLALEKAAARSGHTPEQLRVHEGRVIGPDGQVLGDYWSLLTAADLDQEYTGRYLPKRPEDRTLLGRTRLPRPDLEDKVLGRPRFVHDLRLPGMWHGRVLRAPLLDTPLAGSAADALQDLHAQMPQVKAWADGRFVAVVAERERDADAAAQRLRSRLPWGQGSPLPDPHALPDFLQQAPCEQTVSARRGEPELPSDGQVFQAEFFKPYLAHASIGPSCAIARWDGAALEVWTHSQGIHNLRDDLVLALSQEALPVPKEAITLHHVEGAGCYGHNGADDVALDAVLMALRCTGKPVRVLWSREDELTHSPLGAAQLVRLEARVDDTGQITHWRHALWSNGHSSRPGRARAPTLLAASERAQATALPLPINPPLAAGGGADRNAVPAYTVPHLEVLNHRLTVMPLRTSAMRALGGYANVFAIESFMDEMARTLGQDPLAFRQRHLDDERALAVLKAVTERSPGWADRARAPEGTGHGLAWARYKNSGAWCAVIARVQVTDTVRVTDLDLVVDVGTVVDLDGVVNQIEGGAVQSTSWTLKEQVAFTPDGLTSTGWESYPVLRFSEVPRVRVHVLDRPDQPSLGAGEAAQGPVAAAIANAVADALGVRVRSLPLTPDKLLQAVHAAEGA
jgi:CO/xanthine dehydrogenase Mo-binding subunit